METLSVALILFGGTFIRATFGFGDALFAMPLLSLVIGVAIAAPVVGLVSLVVAVGVLVTSWRHVDLGAVRRLLAGSLVGIPLGVVVLTRLDETILRVTLGVVVIGFGLYRLLSPNMPELKNRAWAFPFGLIAGCFGGAYNIGGPPIVIYGVMRRWGAARFRGTLQGYFLVTSLVIAIAQGVAGLWTEKVFVYSIFSVPGAVIALLFGERASRRIDPAAFERYLALLLIALGLLIMI
jgi:uncharacterized protein